MFNAGLKGRVRGLADALDRGALTFERATGPDPFGHWWPEALGTPTSTGAQNGRRYAVFPDKKRLAIETDGQVRLFDTSAYRIGGAAQQQGGAATLGFTSDRGTVGLDAFTEVASETARAPARTTGAGTRDRAERDFQPQAAALSSAKVDTQHSGSTRPAALPSNPIALIQRLAELRSAGILSEEEFAAKKAELLARI